MPPAGFSVDPEAKKAVQPLGTAPVINPFDENAVEAALRVKDRYGGNITVLTMGTTEAEDVLRHALALGADEAFLLQQPEIAEFDSFVISSFLSAAIRKIGSFDLVMCGREAADWNGGQVGAGIAAFLGLPAVTLVKSINLADTRLRVERVIPGGSEIIEVAPPALLTITSELGVPRYPNLKSIIAAKKKEIKTLKPGNLGIDLSKGTENNLELVDLFVPLKERRCYIFQADSVEAAAALLADKIIELNPNQGAPS